MHAVCDNRIYGLLIKLILHVDHSGWTAFHVAASEGHTDVVKILLENSADINVCSA